MLKIGSLKVENITDGLVTDCKQPYISYFVESDNENVFIKDVFIVVGDWETSTSSQTGFKYSGPELTPFTTYNVRVVITDNYGEIAEGSTSFETGRLDLPWGAEWITHGEYKFKGSKNSPKTMTFKKQLKLKKDIESAKIYSTCFGIYQLEIDGKKVGEDYFAPGFTSYKHQLQYQTYNVSDLLTKNSNILAFVGGGWAVGPFTYARRNRVFANKQSFLCELRVKYTDGTEDVITTDSSWDVTTEGKFVETEFYNGEFYDSTVDDSKLKWVKASKAKNRVKPQLIAQYGLSVKAQEVFKPIDSFKSKSGMTIYNFGQNFAGVIRARIKGKKGQKIVFRHSEILMDGELFTEPLRTAKQEAVYICSDGDQIYSPTMTYMGFQYCGVEGIEPNDIEIEGVAVYSDIDENGDFECSNQQLNKLQSNIRWGAKSNFVDIPTDCPQRDERMGWTGDIALFSPTAVFNFNITNFLNKWLKDVKSEQRWGGGIPVTVPLVRVPFQWEIMIPMAVDHWGDACILVPWAEYKTNGNIDVLKTMYPVMKKYIKACEFWAGLFSFGKHRRVWKLLHHYGDWVAPEAGLWEWMGRGKWTATACLANSSQILSEISLILGEEADSDYYKILSKETSVAYRDILMEKDCSVKKEFQTAYILPLYYKMLSDSDRKTTASHLVRMIRDNNYNIGTGFPGTPFVLFALADNGYLEDAYKMLLNDNAPSWLFEVKAGATTVWERWDALRADGTCNTGAEDGTNGMVSFNHYAFGAVGDFMYRRIAGIEPNQGGYKTFNIKPLIGGGLTKAKAYVTTAFGRVSSSWEIVNGKTTVQVEVPVGTTCNLTLPWGDELVLNSGSYSFNQK